MAASLPLPEQSVPVFRPIILPLVLLLGIAPTANALCSADCVGTMPRGPAAGACHHTTAAAMTATLPEDCPRSGLASAPLAALLDESSTLQAPQALPVGTPALEGVRAAPDPAQAARSASVADRRPLDTTLRI
jgi:hypothetical protein